MQKKRRILTKTVATKHMPEAEEREEVEIGKKILLLKIQMKEVQLLQVRTLDEI